MDNQVNKYDNIKSISNSNGVFVVIKDGRGGKITKISEFKKDSTVKEIERLEALSQLRPFTKNELLAFNYFKIE